MIQVGTVCTGIGSPEQALNNLGVDHEISFACEIDKYARQTYLSNFEPKLMLSDMTKETWEGKDFYSDLFIGGIPCQSFSLAGKRLGELDPRGLLFYDFYRYVQVQQPKYFIIENVKGLLSDDSGKTFRNWIQLLGRSENTHINMFNHPDSLEYNLHWKVLNTKDFGLPQNRERVFLVGIRKDLPNTFRFPPGWRLDLRLKDVLEDEVDEKYYLSEKMLNGFINHAERQRQKGNGFTFEPTEGNCISKTVTTDEGTRGYTNFIIDKVDKIGFINQDTQSSTVFNTASISPTVCAGTHGYAMGYIKDPICVAMRGRNPDNPGQRIAGQKNVQTLEPNSQGTTNTITSAQKDNLILEPTVKVQEATKKGFAVAKSGDSINLSNPNSETRRGRVGNQIANTLDTSCNQAVVEHSYRIRRLTPLECFRLQGFPDSFIKPVSNSQLYKQAGNTISVPVIQAIIKNLLHLLK